MALNTFLGKILAARLKSKKQWHPHNGEIFRAAGARASGLAKSIERKMNSLAKLARLKRFEESWRLNALASRCRGLHREAKRAGLVENGIRI